MQTVSYDKRLSILYCRCRCPRSTGWVSRKDPRNSTISWSPSWRVRAALRLAGGRPPWPGARPGSAGTPPCSPSYNYLAAHRSTWQSSASHTFVRLALVNRAIEKRIRNVMISKPSGILLYILQISVMIFQRGLFQGGLESGGKDNTKQTNELLLRALNGRCLFCNQ